MASYKLAPGVGTLLNLADCYERGGQHASGWARFHEAIALAQRLGRPDREKTARKRADKLEPRLIRFSIVAREKDVDVKRDGNLLDPAVLGSHIPIAPGKHTIEAMAQRKKPFSVTLDVSERTRSKSIEIPPLEADAAAVRPNQGGSESDKGAPRRSSSSGSTQRLVSYVLMAVGVRRVEDGCRAINVFEERLRKARPQVRWVFVEPDIPKQS